MTYLPSSPVRCRRGAYTLHRPGEAPQEIGNTFSAVINSISRPGLPFRPPAIRNALVNMLRRQQVPDSPAASWSPTGPEERGLGSTIGPLLAHPYWRRGETVLAAPYHLHTLRPPLAGSADAILQDASGSLSMVLLVCSRPRPELEPVITAELGACIAAANDMGFGPLTSGIAVCAAPRETIVQHFHPDRCLAQWVDTIQMARYRWQQGLSLDPGEYSQALSAPPA